MITTDEFKVPGRVINLDQARVQHGDKADHMMRMLAVGDPLADAVIVEIDALGIIDRRKVSVLKDEAVGETRPINVSANDLIVIVQPKCLRER